MLKRLFKGLYHAIWYTFAAVILTAAVSVTLLRLMLPDIGAYRHDIQVWVSQYMGYPLEIHEINAEWEGWIPHLYLSNIDLLNSEGSAVISHFLSAHLSFDPIASFAQRKLVPKQLIVSGLGLTLTRRQDGSIDIAGDTSLRTSHGGFESSEMAVWLLRQKKISIQNAQVTWIDKVSGKEPLFFPNVSLLLQTYRDRLQINGSAILPVHYGDSIDFSLDIRGDILTTRWSGTSYISGKAVNIQMFSRETRLGNMIADGGYTDFRAWTDWNNASLTRIEGILSCNHIKLGTGPDYIAINKLAFDFSGKRLDENVWDINLQLDDLTTENGLWPQTSMVMRLENAGGNAERHYTGNFGYLKLEDIVPLIQQSSLLQREWEQKLSGIKVQGELGNVRFDYASSKETSSEFAYSAKFDNFYSKDNDSLYSVNGLSGFINGNLDETKIHLDSSSVSVTIPSVYEEPVWLSTLNGDVTLVTKDDNWEIELGLVNAQTSDFPVTISGKINRDRNHVSPYTDIIIHTGSFGLENISGYLPRPVPDKLRNWISRSLIDGDISSGDVVFRGYISDFPFRNSEGVFKVLANVNKASLDYHPQWPPIDNIDADIIIENNNLRVEASSGKVFSARITEAVATIDQIDKNNNHVQISGTIQGQTKDARHFINQSPLQNNNSLKELGHRQIAGNIELGLDLSIPLYEAPKKVLGKLKLIDTSFESEFPGIGLEKINGTVDFTNDSVNARGISALYNNLPVNLSITRQSNNPTSGSRFTLAGTSDRDFILAQLAVFFPKLDEFMKAISRRIDGSAEWVLSIENRYTTAGNREKQLVLSSDLRGLALEMPAPFGKAQEQLSPIRIETTILDSRMENLLVEYDSRIFANLDVDNTEDFVVKNITVGLGKPFDKDTISDGIFIDGNLDQLSTSDWFDFFNDIGISQNGNKKKFQHFDMNIGITKLNFFGISADNSDIYIARFHDAWETTIRNADIYGKVTVPNDIVNGTININFDRLKIARNKSTGEKSRVDPGKIPKLDIVIDSFNTNDLDLGQLIVKSSKIQNGISIDTLQFLKPDLQINGTGRWTREKGEDFSKFNLELNADNLAAMLETFGYNKAAIEKGKTVMNLDAEWGGTPMDFGLGKVNGTLDIDIQKGQFLNLQPGSAGRLFGLLSLQTLPRRLSLDFSDLFGKGFSFDLISGIFTLENGNAYTNNLAMSGPSADVIVSGRTGLQEHDYDQIVTITPQVSGSLPVASALFGPIGAGVGAVIYLASEMFEAIPEQIDKLLRYQYSITGSWDEPVIEKFKTGAEPKKGDAITNENPGKKG